MVQKMKKSKGFTLIEMLVVIAIIAILVAIIIPVVGNSTAKAEAAADAANARAIKAELVTKMLLEDKKPTDFTADYLATNYGDVVFHNGVLTVEAETTGEGEAATETGDIIVKVGGMTIAELASAAGSEGKTVGAEEE